MLTFALLGTIGSHVLAFYLGHRIAVNRLAKVSITLVEHRKEIARIIGGFLADPKIHIQR
jgi:hypothetical protein